MKPRAVSSSDTSRYRPLPVRPRSITAASTPLSVFIAVPISTGEKLARA